ncbi:PspC domain-containing protein [Weissella ceti]|uniref:PspC domain-containing protein n=1 Tax=Weissella ceti TaxID=759620 RepID=A0ABT3E6I0_9LACO|nr:PspC domain-containing protein [Weissella ceti]MCW0953542.1 PspC domain-containing protein [Weissella ceti]QVK12305.1 PspC domain-containing protein [Weissella ceti]
MKKKLYKSNDRVLAGVLGGFADYFNIDPNVMRLIFIGLFLVTWGFPMIAFYIIAAIIMPTRHTYNQSNRDNIQEGDYTDK